MSDQVRIRHFGGHNKKGHECIIELWGSGKMVRPSHYEEDGQGGGVTIFGNDEHLDLRVVFRLPVSAFKLRLRGENTPTAHPLQSIWQELIEAKKFNEEHPLFNSKLVEATSSGDLATLALLNKWREKIAGYSVVPTSNTMTGLDSFEGMPLKDGVGEVLQILEQLILKDASIPTKEKLRTKYENVMSQTQSRGGLDFYKVLHHSGLKWLENATHIHDT